MRKRKIINGFIKYIKGNEYSELEAEPNMPITSDVMKTLLNEYKDFFIVNRIYARHDCVKCYELVFDNETKHVHIRYTGDKENNYMEVVED